MGKIIINNESHLHDSVALQLVMGVIGEGRVSNNERQYCYTTVFSFKENKVIVSCSLKKNSDLFRVYDQKSNPQIADN